MMKRIIPMILVLAMLVSVLPITASAATGTSMSEATYINLGYVYTHSWTAENDELDHYVKFTVSKCLLGIACSWPMDSEGYCYDVAFEIYDETGALVWKNDTLDYAVTDIAFVMMVGLKTGTYYMNIKPLFQVEQGEFPIAYALEVDDEVGAWAETEPNNTRETKNYISVNRTYVGIAGETGVNYDHFVFENTKYGNHRIYFSEIDALTKENANLKMRFVDGLNRETVFTADKALTDEYGDKYFKVVTTLGYTNFFVIESNGGPAFAYSFLVVPDGGKAVALTALPELVVVKQGQTASVTLKATGDGLKYAWYYKDKTDSDFKLASGYTGTTYSFSMTEARSGRLAYCQVTDQYGNTLQSTTVMMGLEGELVVSGTCGEQVNWALDNLGVLTISGTGSMTETPWLENYSGDIKKVVILSGVTEIAYGAFQHCDFLEEVQLPNTLEVIGGYAFASCDRLRSIDLPVGLKTIANGAFEYTSIASIQIPNTVTTIGSNAFRSTFIETLAIPSSVKTIGDRAFGDCKRLKTVTWEAGVTKIENNTFGYCTDLESIVIPNGVTEIGESAFYTCKSLRQIVLPEGVTKIGTSAFDSCSNLKILYIPKSVTSIDRRNLSTCTSLTDIYYGGSEEDKAQITLGTQNDTTATWHYNATIDMLIMPGDVTGDGKINSLDGLMLLRYLNGWNVNIAAPEAMDVNGDGKVNSLDGLILMRYLNGWNVTLG